MLRRVMAERARRGLLVMSWGFAAMLLVGFGARLLLWFGAGWAEVAVQAAAGLGGAGIWVWRGRPRVTLRLGLRHSIYLDIENVGNRAAKDVRVNCTSGIHFVKPREGRDPERVFGPEEQFGDMDRGQRYEVPILLAGENSQDVIDGLVFEVSRQRIWGLGRHGQTLALGGPGLRLSTQENSATPLAGIADDTAQIKESLSGLCGVIGDISYRLEPPETGGDIVDKSCRGCGWDRFLCWRSLEFSRFQCANCNADYHTTKECACVGLWCKHTPAPHQCRPFPSILALPFGGFGRLPWRPQI